MFLVQEVWRHIQRRPGRSLLTLAAAALLAACMGLYMGNIAKAQTALATLAETIPVKVCVSSPDGELQNGLIITAASVDRLLEADIVDPIYTAEVCGTIAPTLQLEGSRRHDTLMIATNSLNAISGISAESIQFADGWDEGLFSGSEPVCIVEELYARKHGLELGETVEIPLDVTRDSGGYAIYFRRAGTAQLKIVGMFGAGASLNAVSSLNMVIPVDWFRQFVEGNELTFYYDSFRGTVGNPMELNAFKQSMQWLGYSEVNGEASEHRKGIALIVEDEMFIKTAEQLTGTLALFRQFRLPFFALIVVLIALVTFFLLRGCRRELAIAGSLGRPKWASALTYFLVHLLLTAAGCVLALPVMLAVSEMRLAALLAVDGIFLGCACIGVGLALCQLLRFDALALLTKLD